MEKSLKITNILLLLAIIIGDVLFVVLDYPLWIKAITSACFFVLGLINLLFAIKNKTQSLKFCIFMVIGLFFAMVADIVLEPAFIVGALIFALAHILYFVAYCFLIKFKWIDLLYSAVIFVPAVLFMMLAPFFDYGSTLMQIVCAIYALIISIMVGKSISNYVQQKSLLHLIIMIGSILFMLSDIMLLLDNFASLPAIFGIFCVGLYYPAEFLLAFSLTKTPQQTKNE